MTFDRKLYMKTYNQIHKVEIAAYAKKYRENNKEKHCANVKRYRLTHEYVHRRSTWKSYGIDSKEAERIYNSSNNCTICGKSINGRNKHLDHDHKTKVIRGVLCSSCNHGIGYFYDNINLLQKAASYLNEFTSKDINSRPEELDC